MRCNAEASLAQTYPHRHAIGELSHCCSGTDLEGLKDQTPILKIQLSNLGVCFRIHPVVLCMPEPKKKKKHIILNLNHLLKSVAVSTIPHQDFVYVPCTRFGLKPPSLDTTSMS